LQRTKPLRQPAARAEDALQAVSASASALLEVAAEAQARAPEGQQLQQEQDPELARSGFRSRQLLPALPVPLAEERQRQDRLLHSVSELREAPKADRRATYDPQRSSRATIRRRP